MFFKWKQPKVKMESMVYGEYLTKHPDMVPENISLDTPGYVVTSVDYGNADTNSLPFKKDDWIEADYVKKNFENVI